MSSAKGNSRPCETALWFGLLGAPSLWSVQLFVNYALVPWTCRHGHHFVLHLSSALFLAGALFFGWLAWRERSIFSSSEIPDPPPGFAPSAVLMGQVGLLNSLLFSLLIFAQAISPFFISPCLE